MYDTLYLSTFSTGLLFRSVNNLQAIVDKNHFDTLSY